MIATPAMEPVGEACAISLAKIEAEGRICDRVAQPREKGAVVGEDVAIMHRDHARVVRGQEIPEAKPEVAPFAAFAGRDVAGL